MELTDSNVKEFWQEFNKYAEIQSRNTQVVSNALKSVMVRLKQAELN